MNSPVCHPPDAAGLARAVFAEIAEALARLAETGEETLIDLRSLPFAPTDLETLAELLGEGEVRCDLDVAGRSEVRETGFSGVWWTRHFGADDQVAVDEICVAHVPEILAAHPDDVARAARRMADAVTAPASTADEKDLSRG